jgi:outer membrane receptor for ferrienterochelin and colicins
LRRVPSTLHPLALTAALVAASPTHTLAQPAAPASAPSVIDIAAMPLGDALQQLARAANLQLSYSPTVVQGRQSRPVRGSLDPQDALNRMLSGSGLEAVPVSGRSFVIRVAAAATRGAAIGTGAKPSLPAVTVTSSVETLADQPSIRRRLEATTPDVIVDRAQIEATGDRRLSDIAGRLPGTFAGGPPGEKKSINLRGVSSEFARFTFDGVNLPSSGASRNIDLQRISSFIVEDVRYLRSASAEYEADGLAGRIVTSARTVPATPTLELDASVGGLDELDGGNRSLRVGYAGRLGERFGVVAALGHERFDTIKIKDRSELTYTGGGGPAQNLGFMIDEREPKRNENTNLFLDLVQFHDGGEIHLKSVVLDNRVDNTGKVRDQYNRVPGTFRQRSLSSGGESTRTVGLTLEGRHRFANQVEIDAAISGSRARLESDSLETTLGSTLAFASGAASDNRIDSTLKQAGFNVAIPIAGAVSQRVKFGTLLRDSAQTGDGNLYTVDANGARSQTASNLARSANADYRVQEDYAAAYLQDELKFGRWTLLPGLRVESVETTTTGALASDVQRRFTHWLPSLPLSYRLTDSWLLRASAARHVNRPKLDELAPGVATRGARTFTGNPDLVPATSRSVDIGADYSQGNVFFGVNLFQRDIRNLIETLEPTPNNFVYRNVGDGWIRGIELEQRWKLAEVSIEGLRGLSITSNQAFLDSRVDDPLTGPRAFAEQPRFIANLIFDYRPDSLGFGAGLAINHIGKRGIVSYEGAGAIRNKTIKAETFVDLRMEWRFTPQLTLYARGENLTNQKRDEFEYVNGALNRTAAIATGRSYAIGVNWKWQ